MTSESRQPLVRNSWTLLLGPGSSLHECLPLLETLAAKAAFSAPVGIEQLETWHSLFCEFPEVGRILLDANAIELRDVGLIEAFLNRRPAWEAWLVGNQPDDRAPRELLRILGARWVPAPLDTHSLRDAIEPPGATREPAETTARVPDVKAAPSPAAIPPTARTAPTAKRQTESTEDQQAELLAEVERILRSGDDADRGGASAVSLPSGTAEPGPAAPTPVQLEPKAAGQSSGEALDHDQPLDQHPGQGQSSNASTDMTTPPAPARYFRHQVADLADLVQCVDLGLDRAEEQVSDDGESSGAAVALRLDDLRTEIVRLQQFTRTLAYIASPPVQGDRRFDLTPMLEEMLISRRSEPGAPRYLIRTPDPLPLCSDKQLIEQAFDALLFLSHKAAGEQGTVRVDGRIAEDPEGGKEVRVSIRFPAGCLRELEPAHLLEPYALRRLLPELGANSLAAAAGILHGQGGRLELHQESAGGLEWLACLPLSD